MLCRRTLFCPLGTLWLDAEVFTADSDYGRVQSLTILNEPQWMYDITVDVAHTFFVGAGEWLVHNQNLCDLTEFRRTHILNRHRAGAGMSGKSEFPTAWTDDDIIHYVSDVATDPLSVTGVGKWSSPYAIGIREGVEIRVDFYPNFLPNGNPHPSAGMISTAYPTNLPPNP